MSADYIRDRWRKLAAMAKEIDDACLSRLAQNALEQGIDTKRYGDLSGWLKALAPLCDLSLSTQADLTERVEVRANETIEADQRAIIQNSLEALIPWRKGPFTLCGIHVDSEWRSDLKWDRIKDCVDWQDKKILDIGCGNGYYAMRAHGAGAQLAIGIDPSPRFLVQFHMLQALLTQSLPVWYLPFTLEEMESLVEPCRRANRPANYDIALSMGVLYHRRDAFGHLQSIAKQVRPGGDIILETLVVEGDEHTVLVPEDRYAMMNNVWFLPSVPALIRWAKKAGFVDVRCVNESITSTKEQRATNWMRYHSLENFLDPHDSSKTVEGHPRPRRAVLTMKRPA